jgi:hypothetical protein
MRKYLWLLLVVPGLALGQGIKPPGGTGGVIGPVGSGGGKVIASFPLSSTGGLIAEDANTVAHVYWDGSALVDTKGNSWTQNGTVPQVTANPFTTTRYGAGPFSDSNYYSLGTGTDVLDFAGDFTACVVGIASINQISLSNTALGASGYYLGSVGVGGDILFRTYDAGGNTSVQSPAATYVVGSPNVVCFGISGTTQYIKSNLNATVSAAGARKTPDTGTPFMIGRVSGGTAYAYVGTIYELYATATPWSEANVTAIQQRVLGHFDGTSPLSVTRASNATYENPAGTVWTAAPGVARITTDGLLVEPARTNYALQSNTMSTGTAATSPWSLLPTATVATVAGAPMGGTWAEVTSTSSSGVLYISPATVAAGTTQTAFCVWMAKASGTGSAGLYFSSSLSAPAACACRRSGTGTCTATSAIDRCLASVADLGATPERLCVLTTDAASTNAYIGFVPGAHNVSTGTTRFSGAQLEIGTYPTSLIVTAGTAVQRNADAISATVPAVPSKWCIAVTAKPEEGRAWGSNNGGQLWSTYPGGAANNYTRLSESSVSGGTAESRTADPGGGTRTTAFVMTGSGHRLIQCATGPALSLSVDGVLGGAATGAGTGITAWSNVSNVLYLGTQNGTGAEFGGYLKNLKICSAKKPGECK